VTPVGGRIDASGRIISTNNMGTSLTDDHPINFTYDSALVSLDPGLRDPTVAPISNWLVGGTVQCSTCHDAHDPTNRPFLRISNVASALCTTCHIK
jgi:predicted CXXCH cytochrome family protein